MEIQIGDKIILDMIYSKSDREEMQVTLVESKGNFFDNTVSINSPLGECILGKCTGDKLCYTLNKNKINLEILSIKRGK